MTATAAEPGASLPDIAGPGLRLLIVAINPASRSAELGHAFSSPGNPFWRLLHESGITPRLLAPEEDHRLLEHRVGLVSTVRRATTAAAELTTAERRAGATEVRLTVARLAPQHVALLGITLYSLFFPHGTERGPGSKSETIAGAPVYVLPNPSGRNRAFPGFDTKLVWFRDLATLLEPARKI